MLQTIADSAAQGFFPVDLLQDKHIKLSVLGACIGTRMAYEKEHGHPPTTDVVRPHRPPSLSFVVSSSITRQYAQERLHFARQQMDKGNSPASNACFRAIHSTFLVLCSWFYVCAVVPLHSML